MCLISNAHKNSDCFLTCLLCGITDGRVMTSPLLLPASGRPRTHARMHTRMHAHTLWEVLALSLSPDSSWRNIDDTPAFKSRELSFRSANLQMPPWLFLESVKCSCLDFQPISVTSFTYTRTIDCVPLVHWKQNTLDFFYDEALALIESYCITLPPLDLFLMDATNAIVSVSGR